MSITKAVQTQKSFYQMEIVFLECPFVSPFLQKLIILEKQQQQQQLFILRTENVLFWLHSYRQGFKAVLYLQLDSRI